ncbi:FAD-dependent thymidylate synthase [archaeon]|nr:FAD-dependent thymidylate synthase [archaeon]NCQ51397.1 FAD-dependent thymidylate synthase [archaeon]NCT58777.1 FAD-dependent thymidylate synthase [archaeon]
MKEANIEVTYINHMGTDKTVVNAARVSFNQDNNEDFLEKDEQLIKYLAKHDHWSPFAHTSIQLKCKAPIFLTRQLAKHQIGASWNEVSRRYVSYEPEFWFPDFFRQRAENLKQGSINEPIQHNMAAQDKVHSVVSKCLTEYEELLNLGVAPEQARIVLPLNTMTEWYWTGTLLFWARVCKLRLDSHAQQEAQLFANLVLPIMQKYFPVSTKELLKI